MIYLTRLWQTVGFRKLYIRVFTFFNVLMHTWKGSFIIILEIPHPKRQAWAKKHRQKGSPTRGIWEATVNILFSLTHPR